MFPVWGWFRRGGPSPRGAKIGCPNPLIGMDPSRPDNDQPDIRVERRVLALARDGVVTARDVREAELPHDALLSCVDLGSLRRVRRGIYVQVGCELEGATAQRAALAIGAGATLGAWTAAHDSRLISVPPDRVHVLIPNLGHTKNADWVVTHSTRRLRDDEVVVRAGRRFTTVPRTIRDMAALLESAPWADRQLTKMIEEALRLRLTTVEALDRYAARETSQQLRTRLDRLISAQVGGDRARVKSLGEEWVRAMVERLGLPTPRFNVWVNGYEADAYFPDRRHNLEFDGFAFHKYRTSHDDDRRRDRRLRLAGVTVSRLTDRDFDSVGALEREVASLLTLPPVEPAPGFRPATVSRHPPQVPFELR